MSVPSCPVVYSLNTVSLYCLCIVGDFGRDKGIFNMWYSKHDCRRGLLFWQNKRNLHQNLMQKRHEVVHKNEPECRKLSVWCCKFSGAEPPNPPVSHVTAPMLNRNLRPCVKVFMQHRIYSYLCVFALTLALCDSSQEAEASTEPAGSHITLNDVDSCLNRQGWVCVFVWVCV